MTDVILRTKLNAPIIWRDFVSRQRLVKVLNEGLRSKLILVTAPAGYGKSTLLSEWTLTKKKKWLRRRERESLYIIY